MKKIMQTKFKTADQEQTDKMDFQPPLPLGPPPPASPPPPPEDKYEDQYAMMEMIANIKEEVPDEVKTKDDSQDSDEPMGEKKYEVCRDFIRGSCIRASNCKYAHVFDKEQLEKVYTFCHDFQNNKCKLAKCKFVHATVFEEAEFRRGRLLPASAFAHLKNQPPPPPPPPLLPPPPPPAEPEPREFHPAATATQRSVLPTEAAAQHTTIPRQPMEMEGNVFPNRMVPFMPQPGTSLNTFAAAPPPFNVPPSQVEACGDCSILENRLHHVQLKSEAMLASIKNLDDKIAALNAKEARMRAVMMYLMIQEGKSPSVPGSNTNR